MLSQFFAKSNKKKLRSEVNLTTFQLKLASGVNGYSSNIKGLTTRTSLRGFKKRIETEKQ